MKLLHRGSIFSKVHCYSGLCFGKDTIVSLHRASARKPLAVSFLRKAPIGSMIKTHYAVKAPFLDSLMMMQENLNVLKCLIQAIVLAMPISVGLGESFHFIAHTY